MEVPVCVNLDVAKFVVLGDSKTKVQWKCPEYAVKMLEEAEHADITFEVAEGGSVKAHRDVLASVSCVFAAMFRHDMKEKLTATVKISDMTIDGLKLFLLLLYTTKDKSDVGVPELNDAIDLHFEEIHAAVTKYQVGSTLGSLYISALERKLNHENCWIVLQSFRVENIGRWICLTYIVKHYKEVIQLDSFLKAMKEIPEGVCYVIRRACSRVSREQALRQFEVRKRLLLEASIF